MKTFFTAVLSLAMILALIRPATAVPVGVPAPPLQITNWLKGAPVDLAAVRSNKVVVVEFWGTFCPPCLVSIPHLTELQHKYTNDVVIVGVSDEDPATVKKFLAKMGSKMDYTVAAVDPAGGFSETYMSDAEVMGQAQPIPYAFVVDRNGIVAWEGVPLPGLGIDEALAAVVKGTYDLGRNKTLYLDRRRADAELEEFIDLATKNNSDPRLDALGKDLEALDKELGGIRPGGTFDAATARKMLRFEKLAHQYESAVLDNQDQQTISAIWKDLQAIAPADFSQDDFKEDVATHKTFVEYHNAVVGGTNQAAIASLTEKLGQTRSKNVKLLATLARTILLDDQIKSPDTALAAKLAKDAVDASDGKDLASLDVYALSLFASGNTAGAIEWQKKAVDTATDDQDREQLEVSLKKYQDAAAK